MEVKEEVSVGARKGVEEEICYAFFFLKLWDRRIERDDNSDDDDDDDNNSRIVGVSWKQSLFYERAIIAKSCIVCVYFSFYSQTPRSMVSGKMRIGIHAYRDAWTLSDECEVEFFRCDIFVRFGRYGISEVF